MGIESERIFNGYQICDKISETVRKVVIKNTKPADKTTGIKPLCDITTYHTYGYHGFFKPSIAEVLAQIPVKHLNKVIAFEIVGSPKTVDDLNREHEALNAGYHVATTRLYIFAGNFFIISKNFYFFLL